MAFSTGPSAAGNEESLESLTSLPLNAAELATHVIWKLEGRPDVLAAIPKLVATVERDGEPSSSPGPTADRQALAVRSALALTNIAYNSRLRDRIRGCRGFLLVVARRAQSAQEPGLASVYLNLLYRLTTRSGASDLLQADAELIVGWLIEGLCAAEPRFNSEVETTPLLGVLANVTRESLNLCAYVKVRPDAPALYGAVTRLLAGPGPLCIMLALQSLAVLALDEPVGVALFDAENVRQALELMFSLVREADRSDEAHHALHAASDLLRDLFSSAAVLQAIEHFGGVPEHEIIDLLDAIATCQHSYDTVLPLLEFAGALLRPQSTRLQLFAALHSQRAARMSVLMGILTLAACPHIDVACAASVLLSELCRDAEDFGHTLPLIERGRALDLLAEAAGIPNDGGSIVNPAQHRSSHLCRVSPCRLLCELAHTATFGEAARSKLGVAPIVRAAHHAATEGDGSFFSALLLLALQCGGGVSSEDRENLLTLTRSPAASRSWAWTLTNSSDTQALRLCLSASHRLLALSRNASATGAGVAAVSGNSTLNTDMGQDSYSSTWRGRLEILSLAEALASLNSRRGQEVEVLRQRLGHLEDVLKDAKERRVAAEKQLQHMSAEWRAEEEVAKHQNAQGIRAISEELAEERRQNAALSEAHEVQDVSIIESGDALAHARRRIAELERAASQDEIERADLLQRAQRAETNCFRLSSEVQKQDDRLRVVSAEHEELTQQIIRHERTERDFLQTTQSNEEVCRCLDRRHAELQEEHRALHESSRLFQEEARRSRLAAEGRDGQAQHKIASLEAHVEELAQRTEDAEAVAQEVVKAAMAERDAALREASMMRCEVSAERRFQHERAHRYGAAHRPETAYRSEGACSWETNSAASEECFAPNFAPASETPQWSEDSKRAARVLSNGFGGGHWPGRSLAEGIA